MVLIYGSSQAVTSPDTCLLVHEFLSEVEAASHHLLAERHDVRRLRQIPRLVVPQPTGRTAASLYLVYDEVRTSLTTTNHHSLPQNCRFACGIWTPV